MEISDAERIARRMHEIYEKTAPRSASLTPAKKNTSRFCGDTGGRLMPMNKTSSRTRALEAYIRAQEYKITKDIAEEKKYSGKDKK